MDVRGATKQSLRVQTPPLGGRYTIQSEIPPFFLNKKQHNSYQNNHSKPWVFCKIFDSSSRIFSWQPLGTPPNATFTPKKSPALLRDYENPLVSLRLPCFFWGGQKFHPHMLKNDGPAIQPLMNFWGSDLEVRVWAMRWRERDGNGATKNLTCWCLVMSKWAKDGRFPY